MATLMIKDRAGIVLHRENVVLGPEKVYISQTAGLIARMPGMTVSVATVAGSKLRMVGTEGSRFFIRSRS